DRSMGPASGKSPGRLAERRRGGAGRPAVRGMVQAVHRIAGAQLQSARTGRQGKMKRAAVLLGVAGMAWIGFPSAQGKPGRSATPVRRSDASTFHMFSPMDPKAASQLERAQAEVEQENWMEACKLLQGLLEEAPAGLV